LRLLALAVAAALLQQVFTPVAWSTVAPGVDYQHSGVIGGVDTADGKTTGSWARAFFALRIDPRQADLQVVHALDQAVGLETVSSMAARHGAIAAVNGGYFRTAGTYRGDSTGTLVIDGELLSEPDRGRASFALIREPGGARVVFGHMKAEMTLSIGGVSRSVDGLNRPRGAGELIVFTPQFPPTTLTTDGVELVVRNRRIERIVEGGSQAIPADGFVASAAGEAAQWIWRHAKAGGSAVLSRRLVALEGTSATGWDRAEDALGAGPLLLRNGRVEITAEREQMSESLSRLRHPRTAIGTTGDGRVLLAVVDGRQPGWSEGALLGELAELMRSLGAIDAINLDGGGSSTMVLNGKVINRPSDEAGERPVGDAILVLPRK
jgi:exopolysaccharide biosynthesis protein